MCNSSIKNFGLTCQEFGTLKANRRSPAASPTWLAIAIIIYFSEGSFSWEPMPSARHSIMSWLYHYLRIYHFVSSKGVWKHLPDRSGYVRPSSGHSCEVSIILDSLSVYSSERSVHCNFLQSYRSFAGWHLYSMPPEALLLYHLHKVTTYLPAPLWAQINSYEPIWDQSFSARYNNQDPPQAKQLRL